MKSRSPVILAVLAICACTVTVAAAGTSAADLRNNATSFTIAANNAANNTPAWNNSDEDFAFARRGLLATYDPLVIPSDIPNITAWNAEGFRRTAAGARPDTINPLLFRQAQLNNIHGLFEVRPGIYQVRGFDVSSVTFIRGDTGWIVIDPLNTVETARTAMALVNSTLGSRPVKAVIYSHPHSDHYQGVKGVTTSDAVKSGNVAIIAPEGFMDQAISENVYAGNAMQRRAVNQFGLLLPRDEKGLVDIGIGKTLATGTASLIPPTMTITHTGQEVTIDGVRMEFQMAENTEAPVELNIWLPQYNTLFVSENCAASLHNILTPRGAQVRDPRAWAESLDETRTRYGDRAEVMISAHNWPRFGNAKVIEILENERDMYKYINDQTLNLANKGYTMDEIADRVKLPASLEPYWYTHRFYGSVPMAVKATYQRYLGFYDGNPVNIKRLTPTEFGKSMTEYMGGADAIMPKLRRDYDAGKYELVASIAQYLVDADPENMEARRIEADALEQLGYQAESGAERNQYLTAASELRGTLKVPARNMISGDIMAAMTTGQLLDYLSVRVNATRAADADYTMNLRITDTGETARIRVKNSVLMYWLNETAPDAAVIVEMPRKTLETLALNPSQAPRNVSVTAGDPGVFAAFAGMFDSFDPAFNIAIP
ncbi:MULTISPECIES: alkyl/aryl-sulfatase [unclassified Methanoregula]|uniref:alkyl/aryl-sulfatase n=1 Tax=unclassified Methanoregula TaxID=2649730 RepID=UPI0009D35F49|nr:MULTISPECIES: alkyl sulfatase dimerization domain-containing protein [unclassified Methanoregula]OPX65336.1 MAG: Metallo-beta-lactamase superfamily protein [Methanoregula sp. PtaB.Bin085]OPY32245.1 MAG: Metallo-beta-lactamase superfamily protein [Methanoregula sp. PtaU1.Bin006]